MAALPEVGLPNQSMLVKLAPFRFDEFGTIGYGTIASEPGKPFPWLPEWKNKPRSSARCRLTNYGKTTLFNIEIPYTMTFVRLKRGENAGSTVANEVINTADGVLPVTKLEPGNEASYVFYIHNQGRDIVRPHFLDTGSCLPLGASSRTPVRVIQSDSIMHQAHSIWPVRDPFQVIEEEEKKTAPKSPPESPPPTPSPLGKQGRKSRRRSRA
jgi:hypothetical protein